MIRQEDEEPTFLTLQPSQPTELSTEHDRNGPFNLIGVLTDECKETKVDDFDSQCSDSKYTFIGVRDTKLTTYDGELQASTTYPAQLLYNMNNFNTNDIDNLINNAGRP